MTDESNAKSRNVTCINGHVVLEMDVNKQNHPWTCPKCDGTIRSEDIPMNVKQQDVKDIMEGNSNFVEGNIHSFNFVGTMEEGAFFEISSTECEAEVDHTFENIGLLMTTIYRDTNMSQEQVIAQCIQEFSNLVQGTYDDRI